MFANLHRTAVLTILLASPATAALAQATAPDPHHPEQAATEAAPSPGADATADQAQAMQPGQPGQMGSGMMSGMMGPGMMGGRDQSGMMASGPRMHGHIIRIMIAITDADGDGAISLEESTEVHRRMFQAIDADKDGKVTAEEINGFMAM